MIEAEKRSGPPIADAIRQDLASRLRAEMMAELTEVPGAGEAVAAVTLPKAIASSGSRERSGAQAQAHSGCGSISRRMSIPPSHVAKAKPAPDLFLHAAAALGIAPADCLVLEDSVNGVIGAKAAGMTVWGFLGGGHATDGLGERLLAAGAERLVRDWPEAARLLRAAA